MLAGPCGGFCARTATDSIEMCLFMLYLELTLYMVFRVRSLLALSLTPQCVPPLLMDFLLT